MGVPVGPGKGVGCHWDVAALDVLVAAMMGACAVSVADGKCGACSVAHCAAGLAVAATSSKVWLKVSPGIVQQRTISIQVLPGRSGIGRVPSMS
jgi:hypothetical protein